jgi:ethanolamine ammonia-lyase small subunit
MKDAWHSLSEFTPARIAQGRAGFSLPTEAILDFQLAHAAARDAVQQIWQVEQFDQSLKASGFETIHLNTLVNNRVQYLQRPDLGRQLNQRAKDLLQSYSNRHYDMVIIVSNGLSSLAIDQHGLNLLKSIDLAFQNSQLKLAPICLVPNARVALADEIGFLLGAKSAVILVGERPGLSVADSIGAYLTYAPKLGNTDAERNCISNIHSPDGLSYRLAAQKLAYLTSQALLKGFSGVLLKDDDISSSYIQQNFA